MRTIAMALALALALPAAAGECTARSGAQTTALVELYTSEGCSSCPPAERWLAELGAYGAARVVPLALHVDYWDYIGWKDPFAKRRFSQRQRNLTRLQRLALVYTPLAQARLLDAQISRRAVLYLAAYGNRLESRVAAGENRGRTLRHSYVVLQWEGPFAFPGPGLVAERLLALPPGTRPSSAGVAAFVQDRASGEVLQALMRPAC